MTIDANFLTTLKSLLHAEAVTINDKSYSTAQLFNPPLPNEPEFPSVILCTLDSLVFYHTQNKDDQAIAELQILCSHDAASIVSPPRGDNRRRDCLARAILARRAVKLDNFLDLETFRLQLLTQFLPTDHQSILLQFISKIVDSSSLKASDDGIGQTIETKVGLGSFGEALVPSPVTLKPIRTFEEVDQPEGKFVFRMQKSKGNGAPEAGLFELDTNWRRTAALEVREYLHKYLPDVNILA